jgi:hypothetical protein
MNAHITKNLQRTPLEVEGEGGVKKDLTVEEISDYKVA